MLRQVAFAFSFVVLAAPAYAADTANNAADAANKASLTVKVENVSAKGGEIRIGLYDAQKFVTKGAKPDSGKIVPATPGETIITVRDIVPGDYGVKVFQDENKNGKIDTNFIGFPVEPYGFSHDAKLKMGLPAFDAVRVALKPGENTITITLQ